MIKVEENYTTEFYHLSLLWRCDHLKVQLCYAFLCGQYRFARFPFVVFYGYNYLKVVVKAQF